MLHLSNNSPVFKAPSLTTGRICSLLLLFDFLVHDLSIIISSMSLKLWNVFLCYCCHKNFHLFYRLGYGHFWGPLFWHLQWWKVYNLNFWRVSIIYKLWIMGLTSFVPPVFGESQICLLEDQHSWGSNGRSVHLIELLVKWNMSFVVIDDLIYEARYS